MSGDSTAFALAYINPANRSDSLTCVEMAHTMAPFNHDMMTFSVRGVDDTDSTRWTTGTPVRVQYGRYPTSITNFYGYVGGVERTWTQPTKTSPSVRVMQVWCIGASYPLKAPIANVFTGMTSSQIAINIANDNALDSDIPPTSYSWPQKAAAGVTQLQFLSELARDSGCTFYVHRTQLRFYDPSTILVRNSQVIPIFYEKDAALSQNNGVATVLDFHTDITELSAVEGRRKRTRVVQGLDAVTGAPIYNTDTPSAVTLAAVSLPPLFAESVTDMVIANQSDANNLLPARTIANRFFSKATARVSGHVAITQESPVVIEGLGSRDSGLWQVLEATHIIRRNWYSTDCVLGRDSDYDNGVRPGLPTGSVPVNGTTAPASVLVNGQWRSTYTTLGLVSANA